MINFWYTFGWKWWVISFGDYLGLSDACSDDVNDVIGRADRFGFQNFCSPGYKYICCMSLIFFCFFTCSGVGKIFLQINSAAVAFIDILIAACKGLISCSLLRQICEEFHSFSCFKLINFKFSLTKTNPFFDFFSKHLSFETYVTLFKFSTN